MTSPQQGVNLGSAYGTITINDNIDGAINRAVGQFDNALTAIGGKMQALGSQMSNIGGQITLATAPLALFGGASVQAAASFEDAMAEIQARAGLTDEAMKQISATALELGSTTAFSAQEAADGFLMLLTAGLDVEEALATLPAVLTGAAAAGADLGQTTEQVTNIMSSFGLEVTDVTRIVETMNQAAGASPAEMSEMGEALALVGGDAQAFGLSLEQTGAILTIFARNGKVGSEAATQLRSILTQMTADTEDSNRAWDMVNSSLFDANGNTRDFGVVLAEVKAGLENLNAEDAAFVINQLAGSYGRVGFNALLASEGIDPVIDQMGEQASAAEVAEARLDTLNGRFDAMMDSLKAGQIIAFTPFNEWLKTLIERATEVINVFTAWIDKNQEIVQPIMKVVAVLLLIGPALLALGPIVGLIGSSLSVLGVAIGALLSPIGLVVAAVVGLAFVFRRQLGGVLRLVRRTVGFIAEAFNILVFRDFKALGSGLDEDNPLFKFFFNLHDIAVKAFEQLGGVIRAGIALISGDIVGPWKALGELLGVGFDPATASKIIGTITAIFDGIRAVVMPFIEAFSQAFTTFQTSLETGWGVFQSLGFALQTFFASLGVGTPIIMAVRSAIIDIIETVRGLWAAFQEGGVSGAATFLYDNVFIPLLNSIATIDWAQIGSSILAAIGAALTTAVNWATWVYDNFLLPMFNNVMTAIASVNWVAVGTSILTALGTALTTLGSWATWVYDNLLLPLFNNALIAIASVDWAQVGSSILTAIGTALTATFNFIGWIYDTFLMPLFNNAAAAIESVDWYQVGANIVNAIGAALTATFDFIGWIIDSIFSPITANTDAATGAIDWAGVGDSIMNAISGAILAVFNFVSWLNETIFTPMIAGANSAISQLDWGSIGSGIMGAIARALPNIIMWVHTNIIQPIHNALSNFNPMNLINGTGGGGGTGSTGASIGGGISNAFNNIGGSGSFGSGQVASGTVIRALATGTNYVPHNMIAMLHEGESVTPKEFNPAAGGSGGGMNFAGANFTINANSYAEGAAAARGFREQIEELMRST